MAGRPQISTVQRHLLDWKISFFTMRKRDGRSLEDFVGMEKTLKIGESQLPKCVCHEFQVFGVNSSIFLEIHRWGDLKDIEVVGVLA